MAYKKEVVSVLGVFLLFVLFSCTKHKEDAPFFDGLYLKYIEIFSKSERPEDIIWEREIVYRFEQIKNGEYHITETVNTKMGKRWDGKIDPIPYPQVGDDLTINNQGTVLKGGTNYNFLNEYSSYLWLPSDKRKKGLEIIKVLKKVEAKEEWKGCKVFTVRDMFGDTFYYDVLTGFLIGSEKINNKLQVILIETNYDDLKATMPDTL